VNKYEYFLSFDFFLNLLQKLRWMKRRRWAKKMNLLLRKCTWLCAGENKGTYNILYNPRVHFIGI